MGSMQYTIDIKLTFRQLVALNHIWPYLDFLDSSEPENRAIISMARNLAKKLCKKEITLQFTDYKETKIHTITWEYYQAYFFQILARKSLHVFPLGYEKSVIETVVNVIHQKIA